MTRWGWGRSDKGSAVPRVHRTFHSGTKMIGISLDKAQKHDEPLHAFADLLLMIDDHGLVRECKFENRSRSIDSSELWGSKHLKSILPSDIGNKLDHFISETYQNGRSSSFEFPLTMDGREIWFDGCFVSVSSGIVLSARNITKYKQTENRMQRQLKRLSALRSIDLAIASGLEIDLLLSVLLDRAIETLHVDAASVLLLDPDLNILKFGAGKGFHTNILQHTRLKPGQGYAGRAVLERKMVKVSDLTTSTNEFERSPLFPSERFVVYYGVPLAAKGRVLGVLEIFHRSHLHPDEDWLDFLNIISGQTAIAIDNAMMFKDLQRTNFDLSLAYNATIDAWSRTLDLRDKETEGHTRRVTDITVRFAAMTGIKDTELIHIRRGATLHDIGKVVIPDNILFKPGPLDSVEWETMRQHPKYAVDLLSPIKYLEPAMGIPHWHHEKWDGTGYPDGLGGEEIPFAARMFALSDVYDALRSDRPYRSAWVKDDVIQYIESQAGKHFDPNLVPEFLNMVNDGTSRYYT